MELIDRDELYRKLDNIGGCGADKGSWADGWDCAIYGFWKLHLLLNPTTVKITVIINNLKGGELDEFG